MVTVTFDPKTFTLKMKGHAGTDRICAATSMVYYNLVGVISDYPDGAFRSIKAQEGVNGKKVTMLKAVPKKEFRDYVEKDFYYALIGFKLLEDNYPDHVKLIVNI